MMAKFSTGQAFRLLISILALSAGTAMWQQARAELIVERIYANRNEKQAYLLVRQSGSWRIAEVRTLEVFQPEIPYGTPIYQDPKTEP